MHFKTKETPKWLCQYTAACTSSNNFWSAVFEGAIKLNLKTYKLTGIST